MIEYVAAQSNWFVPQLVQLLHSPVAALLPSIPVMSFMATGREFLEDDPPWAHLWREPSPAAGPVDRPSVTSTIAITEREHRMAAALVNDRYAWRGYGTRCEGSASISEHREVTLLAWSAGEAVGTMTMSFDHGDGLPADGAFGSELRAIRRAGATLMEFTRFAVAPAADSKATISGLFDLSYVIGRKMLGVTDVVVEVNPRHVGFYRRAFGFRPVSDVQVCERVGAPAVLLRLDVAELEQRMQAAGVEMPGELAQSRAASGRPAVAASAPAVSRARSRRSEALAAAA